MNTLASAGARPQIEAISLPGAAAAAAIATVLLLAALHALSPEFDPSWRMVSEYANGRYGWVLSLMFGMWALSTWALAFELWPRVRGRAGKIGLYFLIASGIGEMMAAFFDINHPLHDVAGLIGVPTMPIAASLISWRWPCSSRKKALRSLLWTANLIWLALALFIATMYLMVTTLHHAGGHMGRALNHLPAGTIALDGWANRLYVVACCIWVIAAAYQDNSTSETACRGNANVSTASPD
ncbi:MAG TPA: DUF998 domain-containing protein [Bryobacteraceae bacterium]|nr:DUF998 domain-containing protein [Bryobacteraceae bacterium]